MRLLLDTVAVVAASTDPAELARSFTERLFETLHARRVARPGGAPAAAPSSCSGAWSARTARRAAFDASLPRDLAILERACREKRTSWPRTAVRPDDLSLCALPLFLQDRCLGGIVLEVASVNVSFEGSDRRFLDALASEMAVALDRARLLERERERQREEKERLEAEVTDLRRVLHGSRLAYRSPAMESLLATARKIARTDTTVLITGESGTGKEMLAHTLHELSGRQRAAAGGGGLRRHRAHPDRERAVRPREGRVHGRPRPQARQARPGRGGHRVPRRDRRPAPRPADASCCASSRRSSSRRWASVVPRKVDVRIIAATNVDLRAKVAEGRFREDLFHRLNVVRLHVPPLRERKDDILHLAHDLPAAVRRPLPAAGAPLHRARAERALEAYPWPGNVRELQNLVLTSVLFCDGAGGGRRRPPGLPGRACAGRAAPPPAACAGAGPGRRGRSRPSAVPPLPPAIPSSRLRAGARARDRGRASRAGAAGLVPLGKWLAEDLVLAADRLAGGVSRRGAELLGLADTHVSPPAPERGGRRSRGPGRALADVAGGGRRSSRTSSGRGARHRRVPVGRGRPAGRDRVGRRRRRPHGGRAARRHGADAPPPPRRTARARF